LTAACFEAVRASGRRPHSSTAPQITSHRTRKAAKAYNEDVCDAYWALYFLEPMLFEHGLGKLSGRCDRLASDEPET
jgi:hypothetical protein